MKNVGSSTFISDPKNIPYYIAFTNIFSDPLYITSLASAVDIGSAKKPNGNKASLDL